MASLCSICCDNNATIISSLCSNEKCTGNICSNCVSEVIKIKKNNNEKTICMYECPFCKNVNDNTLPHISGLNKEEFNNLIDKKVTEFNNEYREILKNSGLIIAGQSSDKTLVEIIELKDHPWFLGCQFHPEFTSKPINGHPLFEAFVRSIRDY